MSKKKVQSHRGPTSKITEHRPGGAALHPPSSRSLLALGGLFALFLCFSAGDTIKGIALLTAAVSVLLLLFCGRIRHRMTWLFLAVSVLVAVNGVSTLYAAAPKFALSEFLKLLLAYGVFLAVLAFSREIDAQHGRSAAVVFSTATSLIAFLSIDLISTRLFSSLFIRFMSAFSAAYSDLADVEPGIRMVGIWGNANILAGCIGIGVLLSLGLAATAESTAARRLSLCTLAINSLGFVLAFSMGASAMILLAFLAYLLLESPQRRIASFVLMVETFLITLIATFPVYLTAFDAWDGVQPIPLLCMAASSAVLCAVDAYIGQRLSERFTALGRGCLLPLGIAAALLVGFACLSLTLSGSCTLSAGETLRRSAYPAAGEYTLAAEADGSLTLTVESQDRQEAMMHTSTTLYSGAADGAAFAVPEDSIVVHFTFAASEDTTLSEAHYSGAESGTLKLGYKLLPGFIANRLQGLRANQNAIQRTVFFEDGIKLFHTSPIFGRGLGAFENGCFSVQSFYYETKYVHDHYIQTLLDTGVIGLLAFLSVLALSAWSILASRRCGETPALTAALGAALVFIAGHAAVEVVLSSSFYLPLAYGVFALISLCCAPAIPDPPLKEAAVRLVLGGCALLLTAYSVLLLGNLRAKALIRQQVSYESLSEAARLDRFDWADYTLSYVYSVYHDPSPSAQLLSQTQLYLPRLEALDSNVIPHDLAECYFYTGQTADAFRMLEKYTAYCSANPQIWQRAFDLALTYFREDPVYLDGITSLYRSMQAWNAANMGTLTLSDATQESLIQILDRAVFS